MNILHLMLACFYIDNFSYQENMIPKFHNKFGYKVKIIASLESYDLNGEGCYLPSAQEYYNEYNIPVVRLKYKTGFINKKLRRYKGLKEEIENFKPDIIFIHGLQFYDIRIIRDYVENNKNVKVFVDNHSDFSNSATNFISKNILHKMIWRKCAKIIEPVTNKFYGVLPVRVDFLNEVYGINKEKIELLVMGGDDDLIKQSENSLEKLNLREKYHILKSDILFMIGGKIDPYKKQIILFMKAIRELNYKNVKLLVFGSITPDLKEEVEKLIDNELITYIGWLSTSESYDYFAASDLIVFPGRHSVYWEQAASQGKPLIVKYWKGLNHIDFSGNIKYLYNDTVEEMKAIIKQSIFELDNMKAIAKLNAKKFLYSEISKKAIKIREED